MAALQQPTQASLASYRQLYLNTYADSEYKPQGRVWSDRITCCYWK
ncbi:hypothetical protein [Pseudomonas alkylphenolica]|nr:hypothetical protein [Pseudomonas alkylphenolica]